MFQKNYTIFCIINIDVVSYTLFRLNDIVDISLQFYIPYYLMSATKENKHSTEGAMHVVYGKKWHGVNEWHGRGTNVASCIQSIIK